MKKITFIFLGLMFSFMLNSSAIFLTWDPPVTNLDGSVCTPTGFRFAHSYGQVQTNWLVTTNVISVSLQPGSNIFWVATVCGDLESDWSIPFTTNYPVPIKPSRLRVK